MSSQDVYEDSNRNHMPTQQGLVSGLRPVLGRSDTDNLLSYYQSPLADSHYEGNEGKARRSAVPSRQLSIASSDSDYSDSSHSDYTGTAAHKRLNMPSEGGSDRRRVAIVEMDTLVETAKKNSIRSRRGKDGFGSLALVAPPDASPKSYSQLTPPLTAPIEGKHGLELSSQDDLRTHHRSQSEAISIQKSPRDVGIVGTTIQPIILDLDTVNEKGQALQPPPLFIHPQSRSPSPGVALSSPTSLLPLVKRRSTGQSITVVTPEIGAAKPIDAPVASPVVISLHSRDVVQTTSPDTSPSMSDITPQTVPQPELHSPHVPASYLTYKPGIHATAGPLPPPPRAAFTIDTQSPPPPRPPRLNTPVSQQTSHMLFSNSRFTNTSPRRGDIDVMRQALQLPTSVSKALAARPLSTKPFSSISINADDKPSSSLITSSHDLSDAHKSAHRREGAFPPSSEDNSPQPVTINVTKSDTSKAENVIPPSLRRVDQHIQPTYDDSGNGPPITEMHPLKPPSAFAAYSSISAGSSSSSFGTVQPVGFGNVTDESRSEGARVDPIQEDTWVDVRTVESSPSPSMTASVEHPRLSAEHSHHTRTIASHTTSHSLSVDGHTSVSRSPSTSPALPRSQSPSILSQPDSRSSSLSLAPSPPPKSFRHSITTGLKRMSLPRSPSAKSLSRTSHDRERSSNEDETSNHPLPDLPQAQFINFRPSVPLRNMQSLQKVSRPYITPLQPISFKRKIDPNPAAMFCSEVTAKRNASERCVLYAQKINELWMFDCGLEEWMEKMRHGGSASTHRGAAISLTQATPTSPVSTSFHAASPSTVPFTSQPRQTSRSSYTSITTEATFPRRPDASAATDLSMTFKDALSMSPPTGPPTLPYPSLASANQKYPGRSNSSVGSISGSDSPAKGYKSLMPLASTSKTGAFFASLGRKASVSRKDKGLGAAGQGLASSSARLNKQSHKHISQNSHPPVTVTAGLPSIPGGPRAPPNRMLRSQTIMISPMPSDSSSSSSAGRANAMGRRPSLFNIPSADSVHHTTSHSGHLSNPTVRGGPRSQSSSPSKQPSKALYGSPTPPESSWDPEFRHQVDKLSDLMPHADRTVLAGYLRRSGQDILAIGHYLEDEKNGRLRRD
ncbi:hypothetical protein GGU11DRAFT_245774 [Lentinula aff. detonsa]|nr:hypothetical protein GGU11DRAFT_245774 [Lentinula aff. detonsa]